MAFRERFVGQLRLHQDETVGVNQVAENLSLDLRRNDAHDNQIKKGAEFFPLPFGFSTCSSLEKFSYKILADFLGTP